MTSLQKPERWSVRPHPTLALCMRYFTAANRAFDRAIRTFYLMKKTLSLFILNFTET